jgi:hypothetical protein
MNGSLNTIDAATRVMVLPKNSKWENVVEYLKWLAKSDFDYHIDDDPEDIEGFTDEQKVILRSNSDIMWSFAADKRRGDELWEVYGAEWELFHEIDHED